ncbi:MAG: LacI family DNA-binding transcriptional regulator [Kiritimatiellae bacterium]|nr:LacI family DNA-binding transcriptional regulator [Kiritimatiellia bacterium]
MGTRVTTKELAARTGVSRTAVSLILNNRWREQRISPELAQRVLAEAARNHYRPNALVKALRTGRTQTVAMIAPRISGEYFPRIARGIATEAKRNGYHLLLSEVADGPRDEAAEIEVLLQRRVDGLILVPWHTEANRANYRRLIAQGIPLVFVDGYKPDVPCPAIVATDEAGMRAVTAHLIEQGHRRIAFLGPNLKGITSPLADRLNGFRAAMADHGLAVPDRFVNGAIETFPRWMRSRDRPTAVAAASDYAAVEVLRAALAMKMRVPEDVAVTGFSDCLENPDLQRVPLTSVHVDIERMGQLAMQRFLQEVDKPSKRHELVRLPTTLMVRASSGAPVCG